MARYLVEIGGVAITLKVKGDDAKQLCKLVLADIPYQKTARNKGVVISLTTDGDKYLLKDHDENIKRKLEHEGDVVYHLSDRVVYHIADKSENVHCVHAACVSYKGRAIVVPANSGAGKSTFTTWLVANGFDYLTDELILIDKFGAIQGIARPIQIKTNGLKAVDEFVADPSLLRKGKLACALPIQAIADSSAIATSDGISLFIFPSYKAGEEFEFKRLSSAEAGLQLMGNHVNARSLEGHGFRAMMELIRNTQCYSLNYGGFDTLPEDFADRLKARLQAMPLKGDSKHRAIRSFVKREGKMTKGQINAIEELWDSMGIDLSDELVDFNALYGRTAANVLEIGFGNGMSLADMAEADPASNFLGIEVHAPGVGSLLVQVKKRSLENVRVSKDDAVEVLQQQIPDASLDRVQIFFPDPWHKKRHHKRRLIQPQFVETLVSKLKPNGIIHVATDWENYAEHIMEVLSESNALVNTADGYAEKPSYRPQTKYETRGQGLGHGVWDIVFRKSL